MKITTEVSGGDKLAHKVRELKERLKRNNVFVGVPAGAGSYEDGTTIAVIGAVQEYGSADGRIPERSFLRVPLRSNQKEFAKVFRNLIPKVIAGEMDMFQLLSSVGAKAVSVSQEAISAGIPPPNAPSTLARKGEGGVPLVDEGTLKGSITYVIGDENDES